MNKEVSHQDYYYAMAVRTLGPNPERVFDGRWVKAIKASKDPCFNDILLSKWETFPAGPFYQVDGDGVKTTILSNKVCALKSVARKIRGGIIMTRLPKNIREGKTLDQCKEMLRSYDLSGLKIFIDVNSFNHGRDICGNPTAHYTTSLYLEGESCYTTVCTIVASGSRREQIGYDGGHNEAALYALDKLGFEVEKVGHGGSRVYDSPITYKITNLGIGELDLGMGA